MERKELLMVVLIGVLLLTTAVQSVQLVRLSNAEIIIPSVGSAVKTASSDSGGNPVSAPANLQNLPSMVGGC